MCDPFVLKQNIGFVLAVMVGSGVMLSHLINHANKIKEFRMQWLGEVRESMVQVQAFFVAQLFYEAEKSVNKEAKPPFLDPSEKSKLIVGRNRLGLLLNKQEKVHSAYLTEIENAVDKFNKNNHIDLMPLENIGNDLLKLEWEKARTLLGLPHSWLTIIQGASLVLSLSFLVLTSFMMAA